MSARIDESELRRGPWTFDEDTMLIQYIASNSEGHWNLLARSSGLKRTGKSCRLRWLNYLKPDVKRGNLTPQEKSIISDLHSKWGNRWSKIAQHLPGRTDNEIKNYWRTRVQNQARELKRAESDRFLDLCVTTSHQKIEDITRDFTVSNSQNTEDHHWKFSSSPRSSAFPSQGGSNRNSTLLPVPEQTSSVSDHHLKSPSADSQLYSYKYPSDPQCYYSLEDLRFATMSPVRPDDSGLFPGCQAASNGWMADDDMIDTAWNTDELWQFR
ncbi:unnamed protein product [Rhodiola kirilowii]